MKTAQTKLLGSDVAGLVASLEQQVRQLTEMNWWAIDGGVELVVTDEQVNVLMRHQAALASIIAVLMDERTRRI